MGSSVVRTRLTVAPDADWDHLRAVACALLASPKTAHVMALLEEQREEMLGCDDATFASLADSLNGDLPMLHQLLGSDVDRLRGWVSGAAPMIARHYGESYDRIEAGDHVLLDISLDLACAEEPIDGPHHTLERLISSGVLSVGHGFTATR